MKPSTSILLLSLVLPVTFSSVSAAPAISHAGSAAYRVNAVNLNQNGTTLVRGMSQMNVLRLLGSCYRPLSKDTWMYRGFSSSHAPVKEQSCNQLVITFERGRVADIKLVNHRAAQLIANNAPLVPDGTVVATR